ncbi:MAG: alpha/beta hydrolase [Paucibacter sp.]|nr:alpha/beta hydrolase [Roseateles sp.]
MLLRGLSRESGHWGAFPQLLVDEIRQREPGARVLMLDLPGNGVRHRESSPSRVRQFVDVLRADLAREGLEQPINLLTMSLGNMVAVDWAYHHPEEIGRVVMINPSMRPFGLNYRPARPLHFLALLALSLSRRGLRQREARVLRMTTRLLHSREAVLDAWVGLQQDHPVTLGNIARQWLAGLRYKAKLARPVPPILLLCSRSDGLVDWHCSKAISRAWGAPLRLHTRAGHDLPLDDAPWVAQAVGEWLDHMERPEVNI